MAGTKQAVRKPVAAKTPRKAPAAKSVGKTTSVKTIGKSVKRPRQTPQGKLKRSVAVTWQREFKKAVMVSSRPAILFAPFARLCREISENHLNGKLRFQETAIKALQEATENFIISVMEEYCATGPHCVLGQVMAINPPSEANLVEYNKKANGALANIDAGPATGGTVGEIPLADAAFTPAPPEDGAPPAPPADTPATAPTPPVVESPPAVPPVTEAPAEMPPTPPAEVPGAVPEASSM
ncbi:unnamed protein product [Fusarium graminearum]|uniref:Core Histone H2A/H2B/H3 domain-containing protein n=1 Tax=Gibberella zeae TaxID=5518 RepID=A0A2H3HSA8_GIBZA|nr:hypothetical protein FG05_30580 [Fusarium graminearum]KAI6755401.1 hypothetical protein HG531_004507 [Fusarium graminearum]PCD40939.1 hypothetical protein FGRA07_02210 [Fusarium graminearum]CAF3448527.1 unnamed protein product [Fusarium graminearum]CAG1964633.1 unnamed protein product [Fusarium graminearum]